jgi:hypothetical protein
MPALEHLSSFSLAAVIGFSAVSEELPPPHDASKKPQNIIKNLVFINNNIFIGN